MDEKLEKKEHFSIDVDSVRFGSLSRLFDPVGIEVPYRACRPNDPVVLRLISGSEEEFIPATVSMVIPPDNPQGESPLVILVPEIHSKPPALLFRLLGRAGGVL